MFGPAGLGATMGALGTMMTPGGLLPGLGMLGASALGAGAGTQGAGGTGLLGGLGALGAGLTGTGAAGGHGVGAPPSAWGTQPTWGQGPYPGHTTQQWGHTAPPHSVPQANWHPHSPPHWNHRPRPPHWGGVR